jgi:hypothetical protein
MMDSHLSVAIQNTIALPTVKEHRGRHWTPHLFYEIEIMATVMADKKVLDIRENTMVMVGLTAAGEVKMMKPVAGDANNEQTMQGIASRNIGQNGIASVVFLPAYYVFSSESHSSLSESPAG